MKEITYFYLKNCPYCRKADAIIERLIKENPKFAEIPIKKIEESENPKIAERYDYYYVPCLWIGQEKLHEGVPTEEQIRKVLEKALEE
ncbi:MAG TPA: thioredoxin family protein [Firmicutes bacterium]|nr:thioredoxin family protein [Candidatus Fermentithermobacillaceae bacterium]